MEATGTQAEENAEVQDPPIEMEGEFILRLPFHMAAHLRDLLKSPPSNLHKRFRIQITEPDMRHAVVKLDNMVIPGKIYDLPCLTECYKTLDGKTLYKVADVGQMIVCGAEQSVGESDKPYLFREFLDKDGRDKRYLYPHGITPCLKNARKSRFRKTLKNKGTEASFVHKEVVKLLKADNEAISYHFEIIDLQDEKPKCSDEKQEESNSSNAEGNGFVQEFDIFGAILSSSEDSDDDNENANDVQKSENSDFQAASSECLNDNEEENDFYKSSPQLAVESEEAGFNLDEILKGEKTDKEKSQLSSELENLSKEICTLRAEKRIQEFEMQRLENSALQQKFQLEIDSLATKEAKAQKEYDEIANILFP